MFDQKKNCIVQLKQDLQTILFNKQKFANLKPKFLKILKEKMCYIK